MADLLRIGNAGGFWGDRPDAARRLVDQQPDLDVLTLDYLAEVSMSILARQRARDPGRGFAADFVDVALALRKRGGTRTRLVANAGGLDPVACARACRDALRAEGLSGIRIGVVTGDDVLDLLRRSPESFPNTETGEPMGDVAGRLLTANAYLGGAPIAEAFAQGADLVVTGRVADPSLSVGPCLHAFGWSHDDHDRIAGATVAGHLIECGTQVTGGISTDWLERPGLDDLGFPVAEVRPDGSCTITKPPSTGGRVDEWSVKEQLLYEIGDPGAYLSPDATVSFLGLTLHDDGPDRVGVRGATGGPPPGTYKVGATFHAGWRATAMLTVASIDAPTTAARAADVVREHVRKAGFEPSGWRVERIGAGDVVPLESLRPRVAPPEVVLRITAADARREAVEAFSRHVMALVTGGPQGITGYAEGRPRVREAVGFWPCLVDRGRIEPRVEILET